MNDLGTNWSSRHSEREALDREILDFDVLYIGGGPANLISLWHLLNQIEEAKKEGKTLPPLTIGLIEKGDQIGDHIFSGADSPQQYATFAGVTPHVWELPAVRLAKVKPPITGTGTERSTLVPSPSWGFRPQQYAILAAVRPQV